MTDASTVATTLTIGIDLGDRFSHCCVLVTHYTLFLIDIASRAVHIAGTTTNPDAAFMAQLARNLTDCVDGFLRDKRFLIVDRDAKFTEQFRARLRDAGVYVAPSSQHECIRRALGRVNQA